jgi:hypothetical protein
LKISIFLVVRENLTEFGQYVAECLPKFVQQVQLTAGQLCPPLPRHYIEAEASFFKLILPTLRTAVQPIAIKNIPYQVDRGTQSSRIFLYSSGSVVDPDSLNPDTDPDPGF